MTIGGFRRRIFERARRMREARRRRGGFFSGLAVVGSLGWMVVLPTVAGAFAGHRLDAALGTKLSFTLGLMLLGLCIGGYTVWRFFLREIT